MSEGIAERESPGKQGRAAPCTLRRSGQKGAVFSGRRRLLSEAGTQTTCKQVYVCVTHTEWLFNNREG